MKRIVVLLLILLASRVAADVPGHNSRLDSECPKGFQWSRKVAGCAQADCPTGAKRTYTLACSCGEAWKKPFKTCKNKDGLATHCVTKGAWCFGGPEGLGKEEWYDLPKVVPRPPQSSKTEAVISKVKGEVWVYSHSLARWRGPVDRAGLALGSGDYLLTRKGGEVVVNVLAKKGEHSIKVNQESFLELVDTTESNEGRSPSLSAELKQGLLDIYHRVTEGTWREQHRSPFNVRTPTVVTSTRGTEYSVRHEPNSKLDEVTVREGIVVVEELSSKKTFELNAGDTFTLANGVSSVKK